MTSSYSEVRTLLETHMDALKLLTAELVAKETLDSAEIDVILEPTFARFRTAEAMTL